MALTVGLVRPLAQLQSASSPTIYNVSVTLANTEYSQALSANTKAFTIKVRGTGSIKLAFTSGQSGTNYLTIHGGSTYSAGSIDYSGSLYFQSPKAAQLVEIVAWA